MSRLLYPAEFEQAVARVCREAAALLMYAQLEHEKIDRARASDDGPAERAALHRLARISRQLTRAQASLVHPQDPRYAAARAVIGYCDEADARPPWSVPVSAPRIGVAA
jgi:hypothetical protein